MALSMDRLWTVRQAAAFLARSTSWVYKAAERGELPRARGMGWGLRFVPSELHAYARGEVAWAKGDLKGAIEQLSKCIGEDDLCRFRLAAAQEKAGDKAAAAATRKAILDARHGGKFALLVRAWLTEPPKAPKKVASRE